MMEDGPILQQFVRGSHEAFREIFMRYHKKVYYFIFGLLKSEKDAEDLTQEVFLKLWTHRNRFSEVKAFAPYLYVLVKHTVFNYIESKRMRMEQLARMGEEIGGRMGDTPHEELVARDLRLLVDMIVEGMPPQRKTVYRMSRDEGLSNAEIAECLRISKKTVENHLNLALREIRNVVLCLLLVMMC